MPARTLVLCLWLLILLNDTCKKWLSGYDTCYKLRLCYTIYTPYIHIEDISKDLFKSSKFYFSCHFKNLGQYHFSYFGELIRKFLLPVLKEIFCIYLVYKKYFYNNIVIIIKIKSIIIIII